MTPYISRFRDSNFGNFYVGVCKELFSRRLATQNDLFWSTTPRLIFFAASAVTDRFQDQRRRTCYFLFGLNLGVKTTASNRSCELERVDKYETLPRLTL